MNPLTVAASIAVQLAAVIGARRATRNRRNRADLTVGTFRVRGNSDLARALRGERGPVAQKAAETFCADLAWFEKHHPKEAS